MKQNQRGELGKKIVGQKEEKTINKTHQNAENQKMTRDKKTSVNETLNLCFPQKEKKRKKNYLVIKLCFLKKINQTILNKAVYC